jgi:phytoene dehydrogenase-like protein
MRVLNVSSGSVKINLALSALPNFLCKPTPGDGTAPQPHHRGTIHFEDSMVQLEDAYRDAINGRPSARPIIEMTLPSVLDASIAPPGKQFEHERHLKAINEAADQLERLAEGSRGGKVSRNAVKVSAAASRKARRKRLPGKK